MRNFNRQRALKRTTEKRRGFGVSRAPAISNLNRRFAELLKSALALCQAVLPLLDHRLRDLLAEFDGVEGLVLRQAAQDGQLRAQHVTLGYGSSHFSRSGFELVHGLRQVDAGHRDGQGGGFLALTLGNLLGAHDGGLHGVGLDHHVGDGAHHFLLILNRLHVFLSGRSGDEQTELLGLRDQPAFLGEWALKIFADDRSGEDFVHQLLDGGHEGELSAHRAFEQKAGNDKAVDFVGAFKDAVDAGIAIGALGGILLDKAVAAVDLDGFVDHVVDHLRAPDLDNGALDGVFLDGLAGLGEGVGCSLVDFGESNVHHADRAVDERLTGVDADRHVGDFFAHQAEVGNDLTESLALLGVADGIVERDTASTDAHGTQLEAAHVQNVEGDDVTLPDFSQKVFDRNLAVVENDGAGGGSADAHLVLFGANGKSGEGFLYQECGELLAVDFGEDGEQVGETGVGNPHLFAAKNVVLAIRRKRGAGAAVERVGSGGGFRQSVGADDFTAGQARQIFPLLLFGAEIDDGQRADTGVASPGGGKAGVLGDVVGDDSGGNLVHFEAAVGLRNFRRAEAQLAGFLQQLAGDGEVLVLDFLDVGNDLIDGELFGGLRDQFVLIGKILGGEDFGGLAFFEQKAAAGNFSIGNCGCGHRNPFS